VKLEVNFVAGLEKMVPDTTLAKTISLDVPEGTTAGGLLKVLKLQNTIFILINGKHAESNHVLKPNDRVVLYPPVAGG